MIKNLKKSTKVGLVIGIAAGALCTVLGWLMNGSGSYPFVEQIAPLLAAAPYYLSEKALSRFSVRVPEHMESLYWIFVFVYWVLVGAIGGWLIGRKNPVLRSSVVLFIAAVVLAHAWGVKQFNRDMDAAMRSVVKGFAHWAPEGKNIVDAVVKGEAAKAAAAETAK